MADEKILDTLVKKVDGIADDVRSNTYRLDKLEHRFDQVDTKLDTIGNQLATISGQIGSVISKVVEQGQRLDAMDSRVAVLEGETN